MEIDTIIFIYTVTTKFYCLEVGLPCNNMDSDNNIALA